MTEEVFVRKINKDGRVTLPKRVMESLNLKAGDTLIMEFIEDADTEAQGFVLYRLEDMLK